MAYSKSKVSGGQQCYGYPAVAAVAELDRHARVERLSRSQLIGRIIEDFVRKNRKVLIEKEKAYEQEWGVKLDELPPVRGGLAGS